MLTLYFAPGSSSMAVHIALHEVGVPFEVRRLQSSKKEQRDPAYLALNPEGKVPTLVIDGRPLTEVAACLFYLAKHYPEAKLLPKDDVDADVRAISWMSFIAATLHPARQRGVERWKEVFVIADRRLGAGEWALGAYSIVDIHLFRLYWRFARSMNPAPEAYPSLSAHHARMMARPAVRKTCEIEAAIGYELPD